MLFSRQLKKKAMSKSFKNVQKTRVFRDLAIIFIVAIFVFVLTSIFDIRERFDIWAHQFGKSLIQLDEIAILFTVLMLTFSIFSLRRWRELKVEINEHEHTEEEILRRNRELSVLYTIDRAASQSLDLEKILNDALKATLDALGIEAGGIYLLEPDREILTLRVHRGVSDEFVKNVQHVKLGEGISGRAAAENRPIVLDVSEYPTERMGPFIVAEGLKTLAGTPLLAAGELVGGMNLVTRRVRAFSTEELQLLTAIGQQLSIAIQNASLFERVQQELSERKQAEKTLRESEEKYRSIFESLYDVYYRIDLEGRILIVSPSVFLRAGYDPKELIGRNVSDIYLNPSDRETFLKKIKETGVVNDYQVKFKAKDGRVLDCFINCPSRLWKGWAGSSH